QMGQPVEHACVSFRPESYPGRSVLPLLRAVGSPQPAVGSWQSGAMTHVHEVFAICTLAANVVAAVWGAVAWSRGIPSRAFWYFLRVAQASVVVQVILGFVLLAEGKRPPDQLHYVYAVAPLVVALVTEAMR